MQILISNTEAEALLHEQEEAIRIQEEASDAFLSSLLRQAEDVKFDALWETSATL